MVVYFSPDQRDSLERYFETWKGDIGPEEKETIAILANEIGLSPQQIRGWLRNRKLRGVYKGKTVHHPDQIRALEWLYLHHSRYPPTEFKKRLAERLGMTYKQVKKWYQSRRQKSEPSPVVDTDPENPSEWASLLSSLKDLMRASEDEGFRADTSCKRRRISVSSTGAMVRTTDHLPLVGHGGSTLPASLSQPVTRSEERTHYIPPATLSHPLLSATQSKSSPAAMTLSLFSSSSPRGGTAGGGGGGRGGTTAGVGRNISSSPGSGAVPLDVSPGLPSLPLAASNLSYSSSPLSSPTSPTTPPPVLSPIHSHPISPLTGLDGFGSNSLPLPSLSQALPPNQPPRPHSVSPRTSPTTPVPQNEQLPPLHVLMRRVSGSALTQQG